VVLILDEIGLAEAAAANPLKVLHRLLEDKTNVPMIALSNWSLDASKMNRVNFTNRPQLQYKELEEAALQIRNRIDSQATKISDEIMKLLANDYFEYSKANATSELAEQANAFFHGTRDFYNCATSICFGLHNNPEGRK
jgi:hypothetical protein